MNSNKIKIMFVCHGNICRSPMAQFVMQNMVDKQGLSQRFMIASSATSSEELGNPVHYGTKQKLSEHGISCDGKRATKLKSADYDEYDYIVVMDSLNMRNLSKLIRHDNDKKIFKLLDFTASGGDIADPWYTGNFDLTYSDVVRGCRGLLEHIKKNNL